MCRNREVIDLELPIGSPLLGEAMKIGKILSQEWGNGIVSLTAELPKSFIAMINNQQ
jgi:hypothetical protein